MGFFDFFKKEEKEIHKEARNDSAIRKSSISPQANKAMNTESSIYGGSSAYYANEINKILDDFENKSGRNLEEAAIELLSSVLFDPYPRVGFYGSTPLTYYILVYCSPSNPVRKRLEESLKLSDPLKRFFLDKEFSKWKDILQSNYNFVEGWDEWGRH